MLIFVLPVQSQQRPGVGQVTQKATPPQPVPKAPTIDPNLLRQLQMSIPRSTMINSLMGNQVTKTVLENLAKNAKIQPSELSIKTLDGNPVSPTPQGQQIDQLNWNAGIKLSMIKNRPRFFSPPDNTTLPVGRISLQHTTLRSESMDYYISNDTFPFFQAVDLDLNLPSTPATYMIAVQTSSIMAPEEMTVSDRNSKRKIQNIVPLSTRDGFVALTQIAPHIYRVGSNYGICHIEVKFPIFGGEIFFGGFTITRL